MKNITLYQTVTTFRGREKHISLMPSGSKKKITIKCPCCETIFERYFCILSTTGNFLCQQCSLKDIHERILTPNSKYNMLTIINKSKMGHSKVRCDCGKEFECNNTSIKSGTSKSCGCIISNSLKKYHKENPNVHKGSNHPMWRGGKTSIARRLRATSKYKEWRQSVFKRDNFTCQKCGIKSKNIQAHHIKEMNSNLDIMHDINNGITFCIKCHKSFHKGYGNTGLNIDMILEFKSK